ncbi:MAG TPA: ABC transporter ATP-binding protein [Candidatus Omnitrophota bacterium]|nr:ABC transporter ATP-binding protein [Candidatus Omnitrophota bacterium]HPD84059.1 ABC transporter ATP-binding protein [Candidatus Omnitrophota bacterium]HRZ02916.1 ABC transporter ATP-binding protein [Candidatus Omnitrophota bacterium]
MSESLLRINNLTISIQGESGYSEIVKDLALEIGPSQNAALVGSSGSGKTTIGLAILGLLPEAMYISNGQIIFKGENLLNLSAAKMRKARGKEISMIFQEPLSAFNPVFTVGFQIEEMIRFHLRLKRRQRKERVRALLDAVGIPDPKRVAASYPHQLSGGIRQRAMIAQAIAAEPSLLIADEPTSNLDVTLQAHVIELFRKLKDTLKISTLLITHDLGVVRQLADKVAVLYDGRVVETGETQEVLSRPKHPFTCELVKTVSV